jgi:predicted cobalt transporter CbtA
MLYPKKCINRNIYILDGLLSKFVQRDMQQYMHTPVIAKARHPENAEQAGRLQLLP